MATTGYRDDRQGGALPVIAVPCGQGFDLREPSLRIVRTVREPRELGDVLTHVITADLFGW